MLLTITLNGKQLPSLAVFLPQGDYHCQEHSGMHGGMEVNFRKSSPLPLTLNSL